MTTNTLSLVQGDRKSNDKMSAIVQTEYGSTDVLSLQEVDKPVMSDNGVLVRVHAAAVHAGDWHLMRGTPFLIRFIFGGILKPKIKILGTDVAGRVESVGKDVTQFQIGDEVFGDLTECGFGAFAEYVCATEAVLAFKPTTLSFEEAATVPVSALAALQGLRDYGQIQAGQKVLINGASGGVGSFAVQIAKAFGAEVTAVCSTKKIEMVRSLGADHAIDYTQIDVTKNGRHYDLILDVAAYRSVFDYLPVLKTKGRYVLVGGSTARLFQVLFFGAWISRLSRRQVKCLVSKPNQADLLVLKDLIEAGKITPFIDRRYSLSEVPTAIRHIEERQVMGKIAIRL
ncbi:NAD(P)-dependent alcohol dehydrogenase [Tumidithrix elongata RA019]|uniref:NAD(P)-dependent alcohol dehydrogenase n=1 Tax=Tumidithrix elongata BACA0141 TaxID=2716417 RepID=A0AAW9PTI1_9CYAN|nr:NAD(P)-dependent alcohol dehydrogenase [Tumidithrix elongata RA019]